MPPAGHTLSAQRLLVFSGGNLWIGISGIIVHDAIRLSRNPGSSTTGGRGRSVALPLASLLVGLFRPGGRSAESCDARSPAWDDDIAHGPGYHPAPTVVFTLSPRPRRGCQRTAAQSESSSCRTNDGLLVLPVRRLVWSPCWSRPNRRVNAPPSVAAGLTAAPRMVPSQIVAEDAGSWLGTPAGLVSQPQR